MKKKIIALCLALTFILPAAACNTQTAADTGTQNDISNQPVNSANESIHTQEAESLNTDSSIENTEPPVESGTLEALEANVIKDVENSISALQEEMDTLAYEITTFDQYAENANQIEAFYIKTCTDSSLLRIRLMEHAITYAEFIMNSDADFGDKYDDLDELYDVVYEDAGDEFYDGIYDGILEEVYDIFYDGLLDEAYDSIPYEKWFDARSNEYEWWSDARSDCYEIWFDARSDIYEFWFDLRSAAFEKDVDEAAEIIIDFQEDMEALKAKLQE